MLMELAELRVQRYGSKPVDLHVIFVQAARRDSRREVSVQVRQVICFAPVLAVLLMFGSIDILFAQRHHICCTVGDCRARRVTPVFNSPSRFICLALWLSQSRAPFRLWKVSLRRWVSPTNQTAF